MKQDTIDRISKLIAGFVIPFLVLAFIMLGGFAYRQVQQVKLERQTERALKAMEWNAKQSNRNLQVAMYGRVIDDEGECKFNNPTK